MYPFITSSDLVGVTPEIILTITALCILSLEMIRFSRASINSLISFLGILMAGLFILSGTGNPGTLFGGMLELNYFSIFFDVLYLAIGLVTIIFSTKILGKRKGLNAQENTQH